MRSLADSIATLLPGERVIENPYKPASQVLERVRPDGVRARYFTRNFVPNRPQRERLLPLVEDGPRFVNVCSGRRGSKTQGGTIFFLERIKRDLTDKLLGRRRWAGYPHPPWQRTHGKDPEAFLRYFVEAPTHSLLGEPRIAIQKYAGHVNDPVPGLIVSQKENAPIWLVGGVRIDFLSGERPQLLVGSGYDGGWREEDARNKPLVWRDNLRPALSDKNGWCLSTTTPMGKNWYYTDIWAPGDRRAAEAVAKMRGCAVEDVLDPEFVSVSWTTADNDAIPGLALEMETARRQMPAALWRRNYLADFDAFEGQLFDLDESKVMAPFPRTLQLGRSRLYVGFDKGNVGKTSHKSALGFIAQAERAGPWSFDTDSAHNVLPYLGEAEWRDRAKPSLRSATWANRLYHRLYGLVGDDWRRVPVFIPADCPDVAREWASYGFAVQKAYQAPGAMEAAVTFVQTLIFNDRLLVGGEALYTCMSGLHYPGPGEHSRKTWVDIDDDDWDSERYAMSAILQDGTAPTRTPQQAMNWRTL